MSSMPWAAAVPAVVAAVVVSSATAAIKAISYSPMSKKVLLIVPCASYRTWPFIEAAQQLGIEIILVSEGPQALTPAGLQGVRVPVGNADQALTALQRQVDLSDIAGVIGTDDDTIELASLLGRTLGLPHNPPRAVQSSRRKDLSRAHLSQHGLPVPAHRCIDLKQNLSAQLSHVQFPCVVKPVALSASRGVIRANNQHELNQAVARIQQLLDGDSASTKLLIEEFIPGREVAVEAVLYDGRLRMLALFDKPDPLDGPYFEETYYITPSRLPADVQTAIQQCIQQACKAFGLREGPVHAECRVNEKGVWILEVAARTIGGLCGRLFQFGTGFSLESLVLQHAIGAGVHPRTSDEGAGVLMIPIEEAGILRRVEGIQAARRIPYIEDVVINLREGYELAPLPEGSSYLGFIFSRAPSAEQAEQALRQAHGKLNIVVAPLWKGMLNQAV